MRTRYFILHTTPPVTFTEDHLIKAGVPNNDNGGIDPLDMVEMFKMPITVKVVDERTHGEEYME